LRPYDNEDADDPDDEDVPAGAPVAGLGAYMYHFGAQCFVAADAGGGGKQVASPPPKGASLCRQELAVIVYHGAERFVSPGPTRLFSMYTWFLAHCVAIANVLAARATV
jgi:hypothetical protein